MNRSIPERVRDFYFHRLWKYPHTIIFQTVVGCNLRCSHCFLTDIRNEGNLRSRCLDFETFKNYCHMSLPAIRNAKFFSFTTFEALIHPDLYRMMDHVLSINPRVRFPFLSNGMLLNSRNVDALSKFPLSDIFVSLDGVTHNVVEGFKTGVVFEKVVEGIKRVAASSLKDRLGVVLVMHQGNVHQIAEYPSFVHELGVHSISLVNLLAFRPEFEEDVLYGKEKATFWSEAISACVENALRLGISVHTPRMVASPVGCTQAEALYVDIDGGVGPCDMLTAGAQFCYQGASRREKPVLFGNIANGGAMRVFRSATARAFRLKHRKGVIPTSCQLCIDAYGMLCSRRKFSSPSKL